MIIWWYICIYIYMMIYVYVYIYVYMYMYICIYVYMYIYIHTYNWHIYIYTASSRRKNTQSTGGRNALITTYIYNITHYTYIPLGYPWDIQSSWFILSGGFYYIDGLQTALSGAVRGTGQQQKGARICAARRERLLRVAVELGLFKATLWWTNSLQWKIHHS